MSTEGHQHYKYNFLTNLIFKIYFPDMGFSNNNPPEVFIESLKDQFPTINKIKGQSVELKVKDFKHSTKLEDIVSWELKNEQKQKRVIISKDSLVLENLKYSGFNNFKEDILTL